MVKALERQFSADKLTGKAKKSVICTELAAYVVARVPGSRVMGFAGEDNPTGYFYDDGHDFAVIDERYIVDLWHRDVTEETQRAVFDRADPEDAATILYLYGEPARWVEVYV